ncbi:MAG TPA: helicase-related protein, partial [Gemmatimonadaceae bacterium]|nr:helicase-related protein [Gemmatimonadaceae bacterium]
LVILDEAHHARSTSARRYRRIASICAHGRTLLLSATPIANRLDELQALLALFLGEHATTLDGASLRTLIVRRASAGVPLAIMPQVDETRWIEVPEDSVSLDMLRQLPAPIPAADAGDGGALLLYGLARQWASSRAALRTAVRRRLAVATALQATIAAGRMPTRAELSAWVCEEETIQLALPGLFPSSAGDVGTSLPQLGAFVSEHARALTGLLAHLRDTADPDDERAALLRRLRHVHDGERIVAFSEFAETVGAYWRKLRHLPGVARLTARGGEIASGPIPRDEVLRRFAPHGQRRPPPREIEAITLLVTTDLIAEGVDLRDATVVVHLDLPWSPARLEQRVGRARRLGSAAPRIAVYAFRPSPAAEALLAMEHRLLEKSALARREVGSSMPTTLPPDDAEVSDAERLSRLMDRVAAWVRDHSGPMAIPEPVHAALTASIDGWIAVIAVGGEPRLVACINDTTGDDPALLERAIAILERFVDWQDDPLRVNLEGPLAPPASHRPGAREQAERWAAEREADSCVAMRPPRHRGVTHRALDRISRLHAGIPHEKRAAVTPVLSATRRFLSQRLTAGVVHRLEAIERDTALDDMGWLRAVTAVASGAGDPSHESHASDAASGHREPQTPVRVLIVFRRACPADEDATSPCPASTTPS